MDADPPELGPALLQWINRFELQEPIKSWRKLQDGRILWRILQTIEPNYFTGDLPEDNVGSSDNWIPRWQNLKHIERSVMTFIRDECDRLQELSKKINPDLKAIAIDASGKDTVQLLKAVMLAAAYSPNFNQKMVDQLLECGESVVIPVKKCIEQVERQNQQLVDSNPLTDVDSDFDRASSPEPEHLSRSARSKRDPALEQEEKLIEAYAHMRALEEQNGALSGQLRETRLRYESTNKELEETRFKLEKGGAGSSDDAVEQLKERAGRDNEVIADLEAQLADARSQMETQEGQLERFKLDTDTKQKLRDELKELQTERDDLLQKSKASENLKKKIASLQDLDKKNQDLSKELEESKQSLQEEKKRVSTMKKSAEEYRKTIQNGEQEIFDQKTTRKRLDHELRLAQQRYEAAKEKQQKDAEIIKSQEERLKALGSGATESSPDPENLDTEITAPSKAYISLQERYKKLEEENVSLRQKERESVATDGDTSADDDKWQSLQERIKGLEQKYLDTFQENLGLDAELKGFKDGEGDAGPFSELRSRLMAESEKLADTEKELSESKAELAELKIRQTAADSKLAAVDKDRSAALDELKDSVNSELTIMQSENGRLSKSMKLLEDELDEARSLLRHSLLNLSALSKEDADERAQKELRLTEEQLKLLLEDPVQLPTIASRLTQRIEESRKELAQAGGGLSEEERVQHESTLAEIQQRLTQAQQEASAAKEALRKVESAPNVKSQQQLRRELSLVTSAWYDLTRRMQSDAVVVQRRNEVPKSFLNRQRRLVADPSGGNFAKR